MPIPWLTMLKVVPWGEVIDNAPKVAEGARKLWSAVGGKPVPAAAPVVPPVAEPSADGRAIAALQAQLTAVEAAAADLHAQMLASSELIQALAEQNTQLIARVESQGVRLRALIAALAATALVAVAGLLVALLR